jgi:hypothetical protein
VRAVRRKPKLQMRPTARPINIIIIKCALVVLVGWFYFPKSLIQYLYSLRHYLKG